MSFLLSAALRGSDELAKFFHTLSALGGFKHRSAPTLPWFAVVNQIADMQ
jgi:hypothetical protein